MARDFWQTLRKGRKIGKINKTLTLPAFSIQTFRDKNSVEIRGSGFVHKATGVAHDVDNITIEFWAKIVKGNLSNNNILYKYDATNTAVISFYDTTATETMNCKITTGVTDYVLSTTDFSYNEWQHFAVTFDSSANEGKLYVNGLLKDTITTSGTLAAGPGDLALGTRTAPVFTKIYYAEIRVWSETRDMFEILDHYNTPRDTTGTVDTALDTYYPFTDASGVTVTDVINGDNITISTGATWYSTDYPPLKFNGSFVAAEASVSLSGKTSIVFPVTPPDSNNFGLAVTWLDDDSVFQRRFLFDASGEGVNYAPEKISYLGEKLPASFTFEVWNIDGNETVDMTSALTISLSRATKPTSSTDETPISDGTLTWDTTLGEAYDWGDDALDFDDALTY